MEQAGQRKRERERAAYRHQTGAHFDDAAVMTHTTIIHTAQANCMFASVRACACVCVCVCTLREPRPETKSM